jgi:putative sugar O-methyltransferase
MSSEEEFQALISLMSATLEAGDEIYHPSAFWRGINASHQSRLQKAGFARFKLHTNQEYFNFVFDSLKSPPVERMIALWPEHMDDCVTTSKIENSEIFSPAKLAEIYRIYVSLYWGLTKSQDTLGRFEILGEPLEGSPIRVRHGDQYISQDLCSSYREFHTIVAQGHDGELPSGHVIGELGGGYGRLGYVFGALTDARYCFFDITPALAIAQTYLEAIFPDKNIFRFRPFQDFSEIEEELESSQFAFFTANQISQFPDGYFDTFINVSSLHEMTHEQIRHYLGHFDRLTRQSIYLKQWIRHENVQDNIVVTSDDFELPEHWQKKIDRADIVVPGFFERLLVRR